MDKVLEFLHSVENDYKSEYLTVEQEIERLKEQIYHIEKTINQIRNSIDESYAIMSSSQEANEVENAELETLEGLLSEHRKSLEYYDSRKSQINLKIDEVSNVIDIYNTEAQCKERLTQSNMLNKIKLVSKLIKVDPNRAIEEVNNIENILK